MLPIHTISAGIELADPAQGASELGHYYKAINPTPGTGISQTIQASFAATNGILTIYNGASAGGKTIIPEYIRLIVATVGTSTARMEALLSVDTANRLSSGGSTLTAVNANSANGVASIATLTFGALTLTAESGSVRRLARSTVRAAIPVVNEEHIFTFGKVYVSAIDTMGPATRMRNVIPVGPVVIGVGHCMSLHLWNPGNITTPPAYEVEIGWMER